ncbi:rod shape-determining protein [Candidatus Sneabacter namystus]|uniref:Cell shape-determining protein MreB n=1 Tax=Candidatus Sneabacter namystus TaxID=2601646 RepID=A0A5C0UL67_9RICK|nr:rod shape-determining protein [Candidatus Sneabacter namystus]QEK39604.1 rod shape-determining protein [Candidatus Sneabacter namystus]
MFFFNFFKNLSHDLAIDLGTANTLIYMKNKGIVLDEPSVVARGVGKSKRAKVFGKYAKEMMGRTPHDIEVIRPLKDGVIADFHCAQEMLKHFIYRVREKNSWVSPIIVVCVPSGATPVECKAIQEAAECAGARDVFLIEEPMAAAIGAEIDVEEAKGAMVLDIGGGTTEVAILSLGGVVYSRSIKIGGDHMDESIVSFVKKQYQLLIGESTAEKAKITIGNVHIPKGAKTVSMEIRGRDVMNGIPREISITNRDLYDSLSDSIKQIVNAVKDALESTPPELASDIADRGIVLTGGGALLEGLDRVLRQEVQLPILSAASPKLCVALGTGKVLDQFDKLKHLLFKQS